MNTIPLPPLCLTLLPPWPQCFLLSKTETNDPKRLENRHAQVAEQIGPYRGLIGFSQSKGFANRNALDDAIEDAKYVEHRFSLDEGQLGRKATWERTAGKLFLVANLVRVLRPHEARGNPWHVEGQHGLLFDKVWEVEPVNARGGQGAWKPYWCAQCGAISAAHKSMQCATCKAGHAYDNNGERPQLRIIREVLP